MPAENTELMTGEEVANAIARSPLWATDLEHPVIVTTFCDLAGSNVIYLSPFLTFKGRNQDGCCLDLYKCQFLHSIAGNFHGAVIITESAIQRLEECNFVEASTQGIALAANNCTRLKKITGTFPRLVNAAFSNVENIEGLIVTQPNTDGMAAYFSDCKSLTKATGTFNGPVCFQNSGVAAVENLSTKLGKHFQANLGDTPFAKTNPIKAAELTTGTSNMEKWKVFMKETQSWDIKQLMARAITLKELKQPTFEM